MKSNGKRKMKSICVVCAVRMPLTRDVQGLVGFQSRKGHHPIRPSS